MPVSSLQEFFDECRRWRKVIGKSSQRDRLTLRKDFEHFWKVNADTCTAACKNARDVAFICFYGLAHSNLPIHVDCIAPAVHLLVRDKDTTSAMDVAVSLRYIAREVARVATHPSISAEDKAKLTPEFVELFVTLGIEQINKFFPSTSRHLGRGEDAVHALEFLLSLASGHPSTPVLCERLLTVAALSDIMMTDIVACFGILRVALAMMPPDAAANVAIELMRQVKRKDAKLVNEFHFVKILMTLVRIDKKELQSEKLFEYVVAKACIFVLNASSQHRRLIVGSVRQMLNDRELTHLLRPLSLEVQKNIPEEYELLIRGDIPQIGKDQ